MDFLKGEIVGFDKPLDWTSFDVVNKFRYALSRRLSVKKIKVGHAGTLDPKATGVLVLCTGGATKRIEELQSHTKEYATDHITREMVEEALTAFTGEIRQVPPTFSACKVDGRRAYDLARRGKDVELEARPIVISEMELLDCQLPDMICIRCVCSKGTYMRALARDIGEALQSGAHLIELQRTRSGDMTLDRCITPDQIGDFLDRALGATHSTRI